MSSRWLARFAYLLTWIIAGYALKWGSAPVPRAAMEAIAGRGVLLDISCDGRLFATIYESEYEKRLSLWEIDSGAEVFKLRRHSMSALAGGHGIDCEFVVSPNAKNVAEVCRGGTIKIWDTTRSGAPTVLEQKALLGEHRPSYRLIAEAIFSPDGRNFAAKQSGYGSVPCEATLWNLADGKVVAAVPCHDMDSPLALAPDERGLFLESPDCRKLTLIDWATKSQKIEIPYNHLWSIREARFSPDGRVVATRGKANIVCLTDTVDGQRAAVHFFPGKVAAMAFSPNSRLLAVSYFCDPSKPGPLESVLGSTLARRLFPPEKHTVLLEAQSGRRLATLPFSSHLAFRSDGMTLVTYSQEQDAFLLWDAPPRPRLTLFARLLSLCLPAAWTAVWWYRRRTKNRVGPKAIQTVPCPPV
jgi:WD40 repeat protein